MTLGRSLRVIDQQPADTLVQPLELQQDTVGVDGIGLEGHGQRNDERRRTIGGKFEDAVHRPVG